MCNLSRFNRERHNVFVTEVFGSSTSGEGRYLTNVAIMAQAIAPEAIDSRGNAIRQVVLYVPGVGSTGSKIVDMYQGATGASLADRVQQGESNAPFWLGVDSWEVY